MPKEPGTLLARAFLSLRAMTVVDYKDLPRVQFCRPFIENLESSYIPFFHAKFPALTAKMLG